MLAKKLFHAINKNWLDGQYNATAHIVMCCVELVMFTCFRPFRDNTVNASKVIGAASNFLGVLAVALPMLLPETPAWLDGAMAIVITSAGTLLMAAQACIDPLISLFSTAFEITGHAVNTCLTADTSKACDIGGVLSSVGTALWVRYVCCSGFRV